MAAVSTLVLRSMRMIGEKHRGDTLDANEQVECLDEFNTFLEALNNEKLIAYSVTQDSHLMSVSTATYTIGPGATIDTARPTKIVDPCWVRDGSSYDKGFSATSTATITVYPPPSAVLTLYIHSWKQMQSVSTMSETVMFPSGYRLMFESNFAIHLAAGFTAVSAEVAKLARESKAAIKKLNLPDMVMRLDSGARVGMTIDHGIYLDSEYIE